MLKAYCVYDNFNEQAIERMDIELANRIVSEVSKNN